MPEYVDPIVAWPDTTLPPAGIALHDGALFVATLKSQSLQRMEVEPDSGTAKTGGYRVRRIAHWFAAEPGDSRYGRLRDVMQGPDRLHVLTSNRDGRGEPRAGDDKVLRLQAAP